MTQPVRTPIALAVEYGEVPPDLWTLRQALEFFKRGLACGEKYAPLNPLEAKLMDQSWAALCHHIAEREDIPAGPLSYFLGELALAEKNLAEVGEDEDRIQQSYDPS